jgi:hypothetical protein
VAADGAFVGPFRNATMADQARLLARTVFDLDAARRGDRSHYEEQLALAWGFLNGETEAAEARARQRSMRLLQRVLAFDLSAVLLSVDPRHARYAVLRPGPTGIEGFLIDHGIFLNSTVLGDDTAEFVATLLADVQPRTTPDDVDVVLRWFGAQRHPARLVPLPADRQAAGDAIEDAALAPWET